MTDSDDPSRRPSNPPSTPTGELERAAPSLADLALAEAVGTVDAPEDPDDPPLASPDDVVPATATPEPSLTAVEVPAAAASAAEVELPAPEPAPMLDAVVSTRLAAASVGTDVVPRRAARQPSTPSAGPWPRESTGAGTASMTARHPSAPPPEAAPGSPLDRPPFVSPPHRGDAAAAPARSALHRESVAPLASGALHRDMSASAIVAAASPRRDPTAPSTAAAPPLATRDSASGITSIPPLGSGSHPPLSSGSVWTRVRADEQDTVGVGTPMPGQTLPLAPAPLPKISAPPPAPAVTASATATSPLAGAPAASASLPTLPSFAEAARIAAAEAGRTLPTDTTRVSASQVVDTRGVPDAATTVRDAPPAAPGRDTLVTAPQAPRPTAPRPAAGVDDHDTIGVSAPAPGRAPPPPRPAGGSSRALGWVVLAGLGGIFMGGSCMTCLGAGGAGDETDGFGGPRVAVVELIGPIMDGAETVREIRRYARQGDIRAIVVRIDSPGGAVAPSQEIFSAMRAASAEKPVVVSMGTVAASGGFWAAMAGDWVVASPGSVTGSIGVISQTPDLRGLAELLRVDMRTYRSGPHKDTGNPLRAPLPGDEAVHMELISDVYEQFVSVISERRRIEADAVRRFADGRIFSGRRAYELGLVDQLGGLHDAAKHALVLVEERRAKEAGEAPEAVEDEPALVYPRRPSVGLLRLLSEEAGAGAASGAGRVVGRALEDISHDPRIELR